MAANQHGGRFSRAPSGEIRKRDLHKSQLWLEGTDNFSLKVSLS